MAKNLAQDYIWSLEFNGPNGPFNPRPCGQLRGFTPTFQKRRQGFKIEEDKRENGKMLLL